MSEIARLSSGTVIAGKYRLLNLLGVGAMGEVYRAHHESLGKDVAIKIMMEDMASHAEYRLRFEREARVCAQIRHPGIVGVHDVGLSNGCPYLVMDLLSGYSLRDLLETHHRLPMDQSLRIAAQLADALVAAHESRLVHRDLKPENIMIEDGDRPVIVDFGLAFIDSALASTGRMTEHGVVMGTPIYISPEQARAAEVGTSADIYSFACILFEMLSGNPPFVSEGFAVLLAEHMFVEAPRLSSRCPDVSQEIDDLIAAMLGKDPQFRPTARAVHSVLVAIITGASGNAKPRVARSRVSRMVPAAVIAVTQLGQVGPAILPASIVAMINFAMASESTQALVAAASMSAMRCESLNPDQVATSDAVMIFGHDATAVAQWAASKPVMVIVDDDNLDAAMNLLRAGAAEVVVADSGAAAITAKLRKMIDKAHRKAKQAR
jgi:eukaryotic-like serine/threonine-protein kinase